MVPGGGGYLLDRFATCCAIFGLTQRGTSMSRIALALVLLAAPSLHAQKKSTAKPKPPAAAKPVPIIPLTQQERAEQQLNPAGIPDSAFDKRLSEFTTLNMQPDQALLLFPDRFTLQQVAEGKRPYPSDPLLAAMYEVQVYKFNHDLDMKKVDPAGKPALTPP